MTGAILDLATLREIAEDATPGPWFDWQGEHEMEIATVPLPSSRDRYYDLDREAVKVCASGCGNCGGFADPEDAKYVATFHPETVLALLARIEELEGSVGG